MLGDQRELRTTSAAAGGGEGQEEVDGGAGPDTVPGVSTYWGSTTTDSVSPPGPAAAVSPPAQQAKADAGAAAKAPGPLTVARNEASGLQKSFIAEVEVRRHTRSCLLSYVLLRGFCPRTHTHTLLALPPRPPCTPPHPHRCSLAYSTPTSCSCWPPASSECAAVSLAGWAAALDVAPLLGRCVRMC